MAPGKDTISLFGLRGPEDFSPEEVKAFRNSGLANGYHGNPRITDAEVRQDMANAEALANDTPLQALLAALNACLN